MAVTANDGGGDAAASTPVALVLTSTDYPCLAKYIQVDGTLGDAPHFQIPSEWGTVSVIGEEIIPSLKDVNPPDELYDELVGAPEVTSEQLRDMRNRGPAPSDVT